MNKVSLLWGKLSLIAILSLGFMVLGIGCITWAIVRMQEHSDYSAATTSSAEELNLDTDKTILPRYTSEDGIMKSDDSPVLAAPDTPLYPVYPEENGNIGSLTIPALKRKLPIIQGTGDEELSKGVGHFTQSVLPGEEDNCVLSGHRDTVFRQLDKLKIGDQLIVQTTAGTFTYEVEGMRIVHKDDKTVIIPTDHAVLSVITCYPFYFLGDAPDRYVLSAALVKSKLTIKSDKNKISSK